MVVKIRNPQVSIYVPVPWVPGKGPSPHRAWIPVRGLPGLPLSTYLIPRLDPAPLLPHDKCTLSVDLSKCTIWFSSFST